MKARGHGTAAGGAGGSLVASAVDVDLTVNGAVRRLAVGAGETLLATLRDRLALTGAKLACGRGECGACTVLVGGVPRCACITLTVLVREEVTTVEGLGEEIDDLAAALADEGGLQCGFCTPGQVVRAAALVRDGPVDAATARVAMSGNICRCTGYDGIARAVARASARRAGDEEGTS